MVDSACRPHPKQLEKRVHHGLFFGSPCPFQAPQPQHLQAFNGSCSQGTMGSVSLWKPGQLPKPGFLPLSGILKGVHTGGGMMTLG